ncbi:hypothetical protein BCR44DRAFT_70910 [Catenaria anguillulae PL171]|uniref:Uncharacterized protein n=1 Tax=Catenaria anguillulae PL171 TaxID=765915 RepID=A0A1Y2HJK8_9FUNG|nr:hypothetical protein BCR44DRAFT_70910 [Catenaria anguillulae PL171]
MLRTIPSHNCPNRVVALLTVFAVVLVFNSSVISIPVGGTSTVPVGNTPIPAQPLSNVPVPPTDSLSPTRPAPPPQPNAVSPTSSIVPSNGSFIITVPGMTLDLLCPSADPAYCLRAAEAVRSAAGRLTSAVLVSTTARIRVSFFKACESNRTCPADMLAATLPTRSFTVLIPEDEGDVRDKRGNETESEPDEKADPPQPSGTLVEYPQLLLRELGSRQGLVSSSTIQFDDKYDATLQLSATQDWYLPAPNLKIRPDQFDLSLVVLHELVHAIGFGGINLLPAGNKMPMLLPVAELQTVKVRQESSTDGDGGTSEVDQLQVQRFRAPSVFESRLLVSSSTASNQDGPQYLVDLPRSIVSSVTSRLELPAPVDAVSEVLGAPQSSAVASSLFNLATTSNAILFATSPAGAGRNSSLQATSKLVMESELSPPIPGSSLAHVSQSKYSHSPEFLMTYQIKRGKSLDELILANGALECGLGPQTLDALRSLGYRIHDKVADRAQLANKAPVPLPTTAIVLEGVSVANSDAQFTPLTPASGHRMPGGLVSNSGTGWGRRRFAWIAVGGSIMACWMATRVL